MKLPITGRCLCGQVNYEINAEPMAMGLCHCRSCQKETGSSYLPWLAVSDNAVTSQGDIKWYSAAGDSGQPVQRGFCPNCGSTVFGKPEAIEGLRSVAASSLDDPSLFQPQMQIWTEDAAPWTHLNPDLVTFEKNPKN